MNVKAHPPAESSQEVVNTDTDQTTSDHGLDGAACCASSFIGGVCVESKEHPYWVGKTPDQIMDEIEYGIGVLKRHNEAVKSGDIELRNLLDEEIASLLAARS